MADKLLEKLEKTDLKRPETQIMRQIKGLIASGHLKPGMPLPAERAMAERFGVGRGYVRIALQKLEFFGLLRTHPQSGTLVSETASTILDGLVNNLLNLEKPDYQSLIETREILEIQTASLAAERATTENLHALEKDHAAYQEQVNQGMDGMEEDIMFHIRIAECSQNPVLRSLIMIIAQDIIRYSRELNTCAGNRKYEASREHDAIFQAIRKQQVAEAAAAMRRHLTNTKL